MLPQLLYECLANNKSTIVEVPIINVVLQDSDFIKGESLVFICPNCKNVHFIELKRYDGK